MINEKAFSEVNSKRTINFGNNVAGLPSHNYMRRSLVIASQKLLKSCSHDKWEMTRHNSQQSGSKGDWSMMPFEMLKFHTDTLFAQYSLSSNYL